MKKLSAVILLALMLPAHAESAATDIASCLRGNVLPGAQIQDLELEATDIHGEKRLMKGKLYSAREDLPNAPGLLRATLRLSSPAHLAGAAYMLKQTEDRRFDSMYVYLPAVKRVRRISTEFSDGPLLGTNFSYFEFKQLSNAFGDLNAKVDGSEKYEGRDVTLMTFSARPEGVRTEYTSVNLRVDQKTCVPLTAEFMKGTSVRKRFSGSPKALKQSKNYWYLTEMEMRDILDDTFTVLRVTSLETVKDLPKRYFEPATFYLGDQ